MDEIQKVKRPIVEVRKEEVMMAMHEMKSRRARGPSGVTSNLLKVAWYEIL